MGRRFVDGSVIRRRMDEKDARISREMAAGKSCSTCQHFDGDAFCSLPAREQLIASACIRAPKLVVCAKWEAKDGK